MALLLRAYSMGAGTYTGIEAVSNGLPILREPRVRTGRRTMVYMGVSLALTVAGLLLAYQLYDVRIDPDKTLNAVLFEQMTAAWPHALGVGVRHRHPRSPRRRSSSSPRRPASSTARASWRTWPSTAGFPTRFANLSDRFVTDERRR